MATASPEEIERLAARYSVVLKWSDEDRLHLAMLPEWAQWNRGDWVFTHGETREKALENAQEVLVLLVDYNLQKGRPLPTADVVTYEGSDASTTDAGTATKEDAV